MTVRTIGSLVLLFAASPVLATDLQSFDAKVARYATTETGIDRPRALCECHDPGRVGHVGVLSRVTAGNAGTQMVSLRCWVPHYDPQTGDVAEQTYCFDFGPVAN